jgi:hypothetical protein
MEQTNGVQLVSGPFTWAEANRGEWLAQLAGDGPEVMTKPYRVEVGQEGWLAVTDGRLIVFVRADEGGPQFDPAPPKVAENLLTYFQPKGQHYHADSLDEIKEFLGKPQWNGICRECLGAAARSPSVSCTRCEGSGSGAPEVRRGWMGDAPLDRNWLARGLAGIADDTQVEIYLNGTESAFYLVGEWWRVAMMPLDLSAASEEAWLTCPRFPEKQETARERLTRICWRLYDVLNVFPRCESILIEDLTKELGHHNCRLESLLQFFPTFAEDLVREAGRYLQVDIRRQWHEANEQED